MKYLKRFNESFDYNKEYVDMSKDERDETGISAYKGEDDIDFIITKIKEKYPKEQVTDKSDFIDMICWFEHEFKKDIIDEDKVIYQLGIEYGL